jgi:hypothetical protein
MSVAVRRMADCVLRRGRIKLICSMTLLGRRVSELIRPSVSRIALHLSATEERLPIESVCRGDRGHTRHDRSPPFAMPPR